MGDYGTEALRLLIALLIGGLIGLDRERAEVRKQRELFAGVRTFALIALAGALPALMLPRWGVAPLVAVIAVVGALTLAAYVRSSAGGDIGTTTEFAALVCCLLGALAGAGELLLAAGAGIAVAALLAAKLRLERFSRTLSSQEIDAALELGVVSCIVLPLLPDRGYGPWQALNPYQVWLVVVVVSAVSFAALIAMRLLGPNRGLLATGLIGGLVSSTAVTAAMARRSQQAGSDGAAEAQATVLASAVMGVRVLGFAAIYGAGVLPRLAPAMLALLGCSLAYAAVLGRRAASPATVAATAATSLPAAQPITRLASPFSLRQALGFAALFALVLLLIPAAKAWLGQLGQVAAAALSSLADVDAATIAVARGGAGDDAWRTPAAAITAGVFANTLVKLLWAAVIGRGAFRRHTVTGLALMAVASVTAGVVTYY